MRKLISGITQGLGLTADPRAGQGAMQASQAQIEAAVREIEKLEIPDIEKQELKLRLLSEAGFLEAEDLGPSALEEISLDPRLRQAEMSALSELRERGRAGFTDEDRMMRDMMLRGVAEQEQAAQRAVLGGMAERGMLDSGAQLAAQLGAQQSGFRNARDEADRMAMAQLQARRDALSQSANLAGNMASRDFGQQAQVGSARDAINQFNLQNRQNIAQQNLGIRQGDIALQNQEQMHNKALQQQDFQNRMQKQHMLSSARLGQASNMQQMGVAQAQGAQAQASGMRDLLFGGGSFAIGGKKAGLFKDGGVAYKDGGCATKRAEDGSLLYESSGMGDVVPGDSYAGDRVDARINSGEMVLNVPQQQRLMDVIRGEEDLTALEDGDIVEGVPKSYSDKLHGKSDKKAKGFKRLLDMLGE